MKSAPLAAHEILALLAAKHSDDVFVPECKDGPTQGATHNRLDAWVMRRSWSKPLVSGYEIKVSRSDFLRDDKWPAYLGLCNQFWFVAPAGVIQVDEVPADAGLMVVASTGNRLLTKKRAPHRAVEIPESVFRYVLMSRAKITREFEPKDRAERWREWLAEREKRRHLGYDVSRAIREHVDRVEERCRKLEAENAALAEVRDLVDSLGVDRSHAYGLKRRVDEAIRGDAAPIREGILRLRRLLDALDEKLGELGGGTALP